MFLEGVERFNFFFFVRRTHVVYWSVSRERSEENFTLPAVHKGRNPSRNSIINPPSGPFPVACHCLPTAFPHRFILSLWFVPIFFNCFRRLLSNVSTFQWPQREKIKKATGLTFKLSNWYSFASNSWKCRTRKTSWSRCDCCQPWRNAMCKTSQRACRSHKPWQTEHWPLTPCTPDRAIKAGDWETWARSSNQGQQNVTTHQTWNCAVVIKSPPKSKRW